MISDNFFHYMNSAGLFIEQIINYLMDDILSTQMSLEPFVQILGKIEEMIKYENICVEGKGFFTMYSL